MAKTYIVNSAQMKMAEENSAGNGVALDTLMKNAALAVYGGITSLTDIKNKRFAVLCGGGNNGGDGVQLAFLLKEGGGNVTVLQGVTIGSGCVIAAGSVVTHDLPDNCLAAGVPAEVKRFIEQK